MLGVVRLPEEFFSKLKKNILPQWKICFLSAIVFGLIAHLYKITNWLPNWDSLVFRYDAQNMLSIGRWFLPVVTAPSSFYDLPWFTGLIAILLHGLGAVCVCKMFGVKKNITAALIGALITTFPVLTSVLTYNYVADGYAVSFLFSCIAALYLTKKKPNYLLSAILITLSVGIYQAYITVTIMLLLCYLIIEVLQNADIKEVLTKSVKFLITGVVGMVLYYVILLVILKITGIKLLEYQGANSVASLSNLNLFASFYIIKESFVNYFFDFSNGLNVFGIINILILIFTVGLYLIDIIKNKLSFVKILLLVVFVVFLPIGSSVLGLINSSVDYHNLMKMGNFVFYLFLILQYESAEFKNIKLNFLKLWAIFGITLALVVNQIVIANVSYHKLNMAYEKSYGTLIRIVDRIEQTEGSEYCDSILVLGALKDSEAYSSNLPPNITGVTDGYILRADDELVGQSVLCSAINDYCGKNYKFVSGKEKLAMLKREDISNLKTWPQQNSICVIDNVIVIKLGD